MVAEVKSFFHEQSNTWTHIAWGQGSDECVIIDSCADIDYNAMRVTFESAARVATFVEEKGLKTRYILETHPHADHATAAQYLKARLGGTVAIGAGVQAVMDNWNALYGLSGDDQFTTDAFDHLIGDGESIRIKGLTLTAMSTPGHTPSCNTYYSDDVAFIGDTLFAPDFGSARTDFPGGDAALLYTSIRKILDLPADTRIYLCHDYITKNRDTVISTTTVAEEAANNIHVGGDVGEAAYVEMRRKRDAQLAFPKGLLVVLQMNLRAGHPPRPSDDGYTYLTLPLNRF